MWHTQVKQILGTPNGASWSQIHHFIPSDIQKLKKRGELILLAGLGKIDPEHDTTSVGREIISRFHEEYYGNLDDTPMEALKRTLVKVSQEQSQYFENPEEMSLLTLVLWQEVAYLGIWHKGRILLRRDGETGTLLEGEKAEVKVASGVLRENDLFFLGTTDFFEKIPQGMITASMSTEDLETIGEVLSPVVHAREKQGSLAAAVVKVVDQANMPTETTEPEVSLETSMETNEEKEESLPRESIFSRLSKSLSNIKIKLPRIKIKIPKVMIPFKGKTSTITVAMGFLILLAVSIFFGWRKKAQETKVGKIGELTAALEEKLETAEAIRGLDPDNSLKVIGEATVTIEELRSLDKEKANSYQQQFDQLTTNLGGEAVEPQLYYDLNLIGESIGVEDISTSGRETMVLDTSGKRFISLNLEEKTGDIVAGGEKLAQGKILVTTGTRTYVVDEEKIYQLNGRNIESLVDLDKEDKLVAGGGWLGNLYLLDQANKQVWKYSSTSEGLGSKKAWLRIELGSSFDNLTDMAIDGDIWLLTKEGKIIRLTSGKKGEFNQELPSGIGEAKFIAVAQEGETVVSWDEDKKMIWVFNKDGTFVSRTPLKIDTVKGIVLSSTGEELYLFTKDKVYLYSL